MKVVPDKLRERWSSDEIRVLVLGSLGIQIALIFLAPFRKRSTKSYLTLTLWILYLTADYVATLALGNVLSKQTDSAGSGGSGAIPGELTALWAPFLLLHLGGPDTITSYSIEDNELWWRHLLGLVVQVFTAAFAFLQSPPNPGLWIPTILVFIPGLIKFIERTLALRSGSKDKLKDKIISDLGPQNKIEVKFISKEIDIAKDESQLINEGYGWFNIFKRLLVDVTFPSDLLMESQDRFADIDQKEALKMVAVELSFLYDILHTKAVHVHCFSGRILRCCSLVSIIGGLIVFHHLALHDQLKNEKKYDPVDITITYILFGAGLGLEVIATMLLLFSDWTVVSLKNSGHGGCFARVITAMIKGTLSFTQKITRKEGTLRADKPRWSHTIGQHNLVGLCLRDRNMFAWIMKKLKIKKKWDNMRETKSVPVPKRLEGIMFTEAKRRAQNVHIYNVLVEVRTYRGSKALDRHGQLKDLGWSMRREFDECIILWHVATDICYYKDSNYDELERDASLKVSNYMVYLLTQQSSMLQLGYGKTRFEATCDVVKKMFKNQGKLDDEAAHQLLKDGTNDSNGQSGQSTEPDESKSESEQEEQGKLVLADGRRLAKALQEQKIGPKLRWQLISETWMEMLGYAAIHCDSYQHAKALSRGGELLTHFWLLMAQMGVVEEHKMQQFQSGSV